MALFNWGASWECLESGHTQIVSAQAWSVSLDLYSYHKSTYFHPSDPLEPTDTYNLVLAHQHLMSGPHVPLSHSQHWVSFCRLNSFG